MKIKSGIGLNYWNFLPIKNSQSTKEIYGFIQEFSRLYMSADYKIYAQRRKQLLDLLPEKSLAIVGSGKQKIRNNDATFPFRVDSSFWYLTGFDEPNSFLIISKDKKGEGKSHLFVPPKDKEAERWNGKRLGEDDAIKLKCDRVSANQQYKDELIAAMNGKDSVWLLYHQKAITDKVMPSLGLQNRKTEHPGQLNNLGELVYQMRWKKDDDEISLIRNAATINSLAHIQAMRHCLPGRYEYNLAAVHMAESMHHGALYPAYESIVASGENACILHYTTNMDELKDNQMVLIDAGFEYKYYASDITRTFPVNGRFTPLQRDVYDLVLEAQHQAILQAKTGNNLQDVHTTAQNVLAQGLIDMRVLQGNLQENLENKTLDRYFMHGTSHWMGMDVHDPSRYKADGEALPLEEGVVLTVEPGLYFDNDDSVKEEFRGLGIRIEDNILVTRDEPEILTIGAPKLPDDMCAIIGCDTGRKFS